MVIDTLENISSFTLDENKKYKSLMKSDHLSFLDNQNIDKTHLHTFHYISQPSAKSKMINPVYVYIYIYLGWNHI